MVVERHALGRLRKGDRKPARAYLELVYQPAQPGIGPQSIAFHGEVPATDKSQSDVLELLHFVREGEAFYEDSRAHISNKVNSDMATNLGGGGRRVF